MADTNYRDALTGQFTTAANRLAETVSESTPTRHEAPDVADPSEPGYVARRRVPSFTQHDVQVGYRIPELLDSEFQIGIRNLADRQPPLIYSGFNASTDLRTYDGVGRFYWMRWTARF